MLKYFNTFLILSAACGSVHGAEPVVPVVPMAPVVQEKEDLRVTQNVLALLRYYQVAEKLEALKDGRKIEIDGRTSHSSSPSKDVVITVESSGPFVKAVVFTGGGFPMVWSQAHPKDRVFGPRHEQEDSFTQCVTMCFARPGDSLAQKRGTASMECTMTMPAERFYQEMSLQKKTELPLLPPPSLQINLK